LGEKLAVTGAGALVTVMVWLTLPVSPLLQWPKLAAIALLVYYTMVVRGLLFLELHGSTRRSRAFRHRMGG